MQPARYGQGRRLSLLRSLRLVEMQLNARLQSDLDDCVSAAADGNSRQHPVSHDYEARRCYCCGAPYPPFGFGPPLARPGHELWVCGDTAARSSRCSPTSRSLPPTSDSEACSDDLAKPIGVVAPVTAGLPCGLMNERSRNELRPQSPCNSCCTWLRTILRLALSTFATAIINSRVERRGWPTLAGHDDRGGAGLPCA